MSSIRRRTTTITSVIFTLCAGGMPGQTFTTLARFNGDNGGFPWYASVVQGLDGNFYGTTEGFAGRQRFSGTVFRITGSGGLTILKRMGATIPYGGLVLDSNGKMYGTTLFAGEPYDAGSIFRVSPDGTVKTVVVANGSSAVNPTGPLVQALNGDLYGTSTNGGAKGAGTIFRYRPGGQPMLLYSFCSQANCADGDFPLGGLVQATDQNFYGITNMGGNCLFDQRGCGTVFRITPQGTFTTLYSFCSQPDCADGAYPYAGLIEGSDGDLYGTTVGFSSGPGSVCQSGCGTTVFRITPNGALTTVYTFPDAATSGETPYAGLVQATDGNFYGTTSNGGTYSNGTIFRIAANGAYSLIYSLTPSNGLGSLADLIQATDGDFYGTTQGGSDKRAGSVFRFSIGLGPFIKTLPMAAEIGLPVTILGTNLTGTTEVSFNGVKAAAFTVNSTGTAISTTVPAGAKTGVVEVSLSRANKLTSNVPFRVLR